MIIKHFFNNYFHHNSFRNDVMEQIKEIRKYFKILKNRQYKGREDTHNFLFGLKICLSKILQFNHTLSYDYILTWLLLIFFHLKYWFEFRSLLKFLLSHSYVRNPLNQFMYLVCRTQLIHRFRTVLS